MIRCYKNHTLLLWTSNNPEPPSYHEENVRYHQILIVGTPQKCLTSIPQSCQAYQKQAV